MFYYLLHESRIALALLILGFLVLVLPSQLRNRVYLSATLFAGLNAGIITTVMLAGLIGVGPDMDLIRHLNVFFTIPLPSVYLSSLIVGATIVPRYLLPSPTLFKVMLAILGGLLAYFGLFLLVSRVIEAALLTAVEGPLSWDQLQGMVERLVENLIRPAPLALAIYLGPALGALIGTALIMSASLNTQD